MAQVFVLPTGATRGRLDDVIDPAPDATDRGTRDHRLLRRGDFPVLRDIPTRWADVDVYGHVNNVVHYSMFAPR